MAIPGEVSTLFEKNLQNGKRLRVLCCDICDVEVEGLVLPCGVSIDFGGLVGQAMIKRSPSLLQASATAGNVNMPVGGGVPFIEREIERLFHNIQLPNNSGFRAPQTNGYIIPTHSPKWDENREADCSEELYQSAQNCLKEGQNRKLNSVAIPAIGSGGNKIPKQLAVITLVNAIKHFLTEPPGGSTTIKDVYFVLFDKQAVELFKTELIALVE